MYFNVRLSHKNKAKRLKTNNVSFSVFRVWVSNYTDVGGCFVVDYFFLAEEEGAFLLPVAVGFVLPGGVEDGFGY